MGQDAAPARVLGILEAASRLDLPVRLRAYLPLAENMPDGAAYRPGDIVRCANGKTVEITNTDAEGRMILADALAWAASEAPDAMVEYSTLTGACVVALGPTGAGLFTSSDDLAAGLLEPRQEPRASGSGGCRSGPSSSRRCAAATPTSRTPAGAGAEPPPRRPSSRSSSATVAEWAHLDIAGPAYVGGDGNASAAPPATASR